MNYLIAYFLIWFVTSMSFLVEYRKSGNEPTNLDMMCMSLVAAIWPISLTLLAVEWFINFRKR